MSEYLFLYRGGEAQNWTPEQAQKNTARWMAWIKDLGEKGHLKDPGHPLEKSGKIVKAHKQVTDGPFAEAKDLVGGFTLVKAHDLNAAVALTNGCPILDIGGFVEVRPILQM